MKDAGLCIGKTPKGKFKAYVWGQPDLHLMDWAGCNYRYKCIEGQPHRGFNIFNEAKKFALSKFKSQKDVNNYASECGDGTFFSEEKHNQMKPEWVRFSNENI